MLHTLAEKGYGRAMYLLGVYYMDYDMTGFEEANEEANEEEADKWLARGFEIGDKLAAVCYEETSKELFDNVYSMAEEGDIFAQYELALLYYTGDGCEKNDDEYLYWIRKSSESGLWLSQVELGGYYYFMKAEIGDNNYIMYVKQSLIWYEKAAKIGNVYAMNRLAEIYWYCFEDEEKAKKWTVEAAHQGNQKAIENLKEWFGIVF